MKLPIGVCVWWCMEVRNVAAPVKHDFRQVAKSIVPTLFNLGVLGVYGKRCCPANPCTERVPSIATGDDSLSEMFLHMFAFWSMEKTLYAGPRG